MKARAVVVGGGVMGVSIAMHLARRLDPLREPVVLLEKTHLGAGSSGRSGAILRQHYSFPELAGMARDSLRAYAAFANETGRPIGFQRTGVLTLAEPDRPEDVEMVRCNVAMMIDLGIDTALVGPDEMRELVPGIAVLNGTVGAWEPGGGVVDPQRTVEAFAELGRSRGLTTRIGCGARAIEIEDGAVRAVETDAGAIETACVVVAAGPWTRALLAPLGIDLPLRVLRPEQHFLKMPLAPRGGAFTPSATRSRHHPLDEELEERLGPLEDEPPPAAHPVLLDVANRFYARCEPAEARTRIGGMDLTRDLEVPDPDQLDERVSEPFQTWARGALERRMPVYRGEPDAASFAAMYTMTPDSQAVIGELPEAAGLFVVSGFSGHGFKLAPSIGEGVTQMVLGEPVSAFEPPFFSPARFRTGSPHAGRAFGL